MSVKIAEYRSKSNPGKMYNIIKANDNTLYCNCWQWKRHRTCEHLEHFINNVVPKYEAAKRLNNHDDDGELLVAIDKAIDTLRYAIDKAIDTLR